MDFLVNYFQAILSGGWMDGYKLCTSMVTRIESIHLGFEGLVECMPVMLNFEGSLGKICWRADGDRIELE